MGKKNAKGEYNDFLDGEKLRDNTAVRTTLEAPSSSSRQDISPPPTRRDGKSKSSKGKRGQSGPKKPQLTHFLCLPLINEGSRSRFEKGLEKLREEVEKEGLVPAKAVRPVGTLHLTLGVMALDGPGLEGAERCLHELDLRSLLRIGAVKRTEQQGGVQLDAPVSSTSASRTDAQLVEHSPLSVDLKALVPMQQPHKTSILYAEPVDSSSRLYPFASALRDHFTEQGFLVEDSRPLRLHATIINTIYAKPGGRRGNKTPAKLQEKTKPVETARIEDTASERGEPSLQPESSTGGVRTLKEEGADRSEGNGPNAKSWMRFDAIQLIDRYKDFLWAEGVVLDRVQICKMGAKKTLDENGNVLDEKYEVVAEKIV